ncbi:MAG: MFS transporter [Timaviella obliquedivisa GSE-PSE-MK23-08B]|jgi:MFS family permease|nr:MFS transporter [Timaviella obliquedivisa GSE-PSE-MK23-08B]
MHTKKNVALLATCQALSMTSITMLFTVAALIGSQLASDRSLATLPIALLQVAVMLTTIPASLLMQRRGRRFGFVVGTLVGIAGAGVGIWAVLGRNFLVFCIAMILLGIFNGFTGFYRFAAAEVAEEEFRAQAISLVVAGGVVAALVGPGLANWAKDWFPAAFAGSLVPIIVLQCLTLGVLAGIEMPPLEKIDLKGGRSLLTIMRQPVFLVALLGSVMGYSVMVLIMTATPLAIVGFQHPFHEAATVLQWHVLGMFAPSFFTGFLIARFGVLKIILCGIALNLVCVAINASGIDIFHFRSALLLLGIGWNFLFIGSTTLLTQAYLPAEKAKTQAAHDFLMFSFVAIAAYSSGHILNHGGWAVVNYAALPGLAIALIAVLWFQQQHVQQTNEG